MLANTARGEVLLTIDGAPVKLCVTLGALAMLEGALEVGSLQELGERLARLTAGDLLIVLAALSGRGVAELANAEIAPKQAAAAVAAAFQAALADED